MSLSISLMLSLSLPYLHISGVASTLDALCWNALNSCMKPMDQSRQLAFIVSSLISAIYRHASKSSVSLPARRRAWHRFWFAVCHKDVKSHPNSTTKSSYLGCVASLVKKVPVLTAAVKWFAASAGQARSKALFPHWICRYTWYAKCRNISVHYLHMNLKFCAW